MTESESFLDELLKEAEEKEELQTMAYFDLIILEVANLEKQVESTFDQAQKESEIIHDWALRKNQKTSERIELLKSKLEVWLRNSKQKTMDLPNGILKIRKKPDKVEVIDLDAFLNNATEEMVIVVPEQIKPSLSGIKAVIKRSGRIPKGVQLIEGIVSTHLPPCYHPCCYYFL